MSDDDARRLERILKRDGKLGEFVLMALEGMTHDELAHVAHLLPAIVERNRWLKSPAAQALARGLRGGARLQAGDVTPEQLVEELKARPLGVESHPEIPTSSHAGGTP